MSLSDFITSLQADMKSRIETECRAHMTKLLEDSFARKWEEYSARAISSAEITSHYTPKYGELNFDDGKYGSVVSSRHLAHTKARKEKFKFNSHTVYFIHCLLEIRTSWSQHNGDQSYMNGVLIDNYGFTHHISASTWNTDESLHPKTDIHIDCLAHEHGTGKPKYVYPLSNTLIDSIKTNDCVTTINQNGHTASYSGMTTSELTKKLEHVRKQAAEFFEKSVSSNALMKVNLENAGLKAKCTDLERRLAEAEAKLRAVEASSPSEDLLGISNIVVETMTEPSKN